MPPRYASPRPRALTGQKAATSARTGLALLDPTLKFLGADSGFAALLGLLETVLAGHTLDSVAPELAEQVRARVTAGEEAGFCVLRRSAETEGGDTGRACGWRHRPIRNAAGEVIAIVLALQEPGDAGSDKLPYRELFECHPQPMWVYDLETLAFLAVNDAAVHKYGYRREEFLRMTIADIRPPEDVAALRANVERVEEGLDEAGRWRHRTRGGALIDVEIVSHTLTFAGRACELVMATDVTERRRLELERKRALVEAQLALSARDDFLSTASHELRTPLAALQLMVQGMLRSIRPGPGGEVEVPRARLQAMERQTRRMTALAEALLDVSRLSRSGSRVFTYEPVDLAQLAREVAMRLSDAFARSGSTLAIESGAPVVGQWDRLGLDLVLTNLLSNAAKYGAGNPVQLTVWSGDGEARLSVHDHGIGIAPEDRRRIFDRFERAVSPEHFAGLGLGLWISNQIVERLGGSIHVESQVGSGTTFLVTLPLQPGESPDAPQDPPRASPALT